MKRVTGLMLLFFLILPTLIFAEELTTPSGIPIAELEKVIDEYTADYIGKTVAGANIAVVKNNQVVFLKGYGNADIENDIPMDPETSILEWGSITKLFVGVAAMQLSELGQLDLEADINTYLPAGFLKPTTFAEPITMLNLLNHNAGYEDTIFDLLYDSTENITSVQEALKLTEPEQAYKPGTVVAYSNFSTSLAAYVIEQITGQEFYNYVSEQIFAPLGMDNTSIHLAIEKDREIVQNKIKGYALTPRGELVESDPSYLSLYPSGGNNGPITDLIQFARALMPANGETSPLFESNVALNELLSRSYSAHEDAVGLAHGSWEYDGKYRGLFHGGNTVSFSTNLHIVPEENFAVIILTNQGRESDITFGLVDELVGRSERVAATGDDLPSTEAVEGTYVSARKMESGFTNMYYYYFSPPQVKAKNDEEIELTVAGDTATYIQTSPGVYKMTAGPNSFLPNSVLYFHINNGQAEQISTTYADYLPMDKSLLYLYVTLALIIWCAIYFLAGPTIIIVRIFQRRKNGQKAKTLGKWNQLLNLSGAALILNLVATGIRMVINPNRAYTDLYLHFGLNYLFSALMLVALVMVIWTWKGKRVKVTTMQKVGYLLSGLSGFGLIFWLMIWELYG